MLPADRSTPFILLDDSRHPDLAGQSLLFLDPEKIISAHSLDEVPAALAEIDEAHAAGFHTAGWVCYEAAAAFEPKIKAAVKHWPEEPLVWMMVCRAPLEIGPSVVDVWLQERAKYSECDVWFRQTGLSKPEYHERLAAIKNYITAGDIYQANFTFPKLAQLAGDPVALYRRLRKAQPVEYGAFIQTGEIDVLSFSPELFVRRAGDQVSARPMKGTAARCDNIVEDREAAIALSADEKSRAENLMIVDLLRNDLSRLARPGTVQVSDLFTIESYPTLHQMTSGISAECPPDLKPSELLKALFPCGSVTGAPKIRAMEVIAEQETSARGIYCGAIGYFSPVADEAPLRWSLNVPIRTIVVNENGRARLGVGSGVVADSVIDAEYEECHLKSQFVEAHTDTDFHLIETMRGELGDIPLLELHMSRLEQSAAKLGISFDRAAAKEKALVACDADDNCRVRLGLDKEGRVSVSISDMPQNTDEGAGLPTVGLAEERLQSDNPSLGYKSSQRGLYAAATKTAAQHGHADILFFNEQDELVEGAISNVVVEVRGQVITPPTSSGALPGVKRESLFLGGDFGLVQAPITRADLVNADRVYLINALRGMREVHVNFAPISVADSTDSL